MRRRNEKTTERILELVKSTPIGLTIEEVSERLGISRTTASGRLHYLEGQRKIVSRELGQSRLHYPRTRRFEQWLK